MPDYKRLEEIEIRLAYLEDLVDSLNQTVIRLNQENAQQMRQMQTMLKSFQTLQQLFITSTQTSDEKPPHY